MLATSGMDAIVDFIAREDPKFPGAIRGATAPEIERLERAVERPLPAAYRDFLLRMGRSTDWLQLGAARFDIESLIRYHEWDVLGDPPGHLLIGRCNDDPHYNFYLWETASGQSRIVSFPPPPVDGFEQWALTKSRRIAGSLAQWIGDAALQVLRDYKMPHHARIGGDSATGESRILGLDTVAAEFGLKPLWFSNAWARTYAGPGLMASALETESMRLIVDVRAETRKAFDACFPGIAAYVKAR